MIRLVMVTASLSWRVSLIYRYDYVTAMNMSLLIYHSRVLVKVNGVIGGAVLAKNLEFPDGYRDIKIIDTHSGKLV